MTQYGFYFNSKRCTGCSTCNMACKDYKDLSQTIAYRKVYDFEGGDTTETDGVVTTSCFVYHVSRSCQHCDAPACVAACPQGSMVKDEETGLVFNDPETCIGCGMCVTACPYDAPTVDTELKLSVKCNGCHERVVKGLKPICVEACPLRALEFGPIADLKIAHPGCDANIAPLPDPSRTQPNLLVDKCAAAVPYNGTGKVTNVKELEDVPARKMFNEYSIA